MTAASPSTSAEDRLAIGAYGVIRRLRPLVRAMGKDDLDGTALAGVVVGLELGLHAAAVDPAAGRKLLAWLHRRVYQGVPERERQTVEREADKLRRLVR